MPPMLTDKWGDRENILVKGQVPRDEIVKYVKAADVCIGPLGSTRAIPLKVLEYMISGKPVVTGVNSVTRDLAIDGYNCLCVEPTPSHVAEAIVRIIEDPDLAHILGENARKTASRYTWENISKELKTVLIEAIG